jgi:hypothetical protein
VIRGAEEIARMTTDHWGAPAAAVMAYLSTPYTLYDGGLDKAAADAAEIAAWLTGSGVFVYSPIVHMHQLAVHGGLDPHERSIFLPANLMMMRRCEVLIVGRLDGWQRSEGVRDEICWYIRERRVGYALDPALKLMYRLFGPGLPQPVDLAHDKTRSQHAGSSG